MPLEMVNIFDPANDAEAEIIKTILEEAGIIAEVISFRDTAFDGLFQAQKGWGKIRVAQTEADKARQIIEEWFAAAPLEDDEDAEDDDENENRQDE